ncbi:MAG: YchJ family protein [Planctomycetes bacterium]|nr:YchJ family protein [Planctomycetota bacterium]
MNCPCGSGSAFEQCCGPYLSGERWPDSAATLMRARYTAFATGNVDFILGSHDPATRDELDRNLIEQWSKQSEWHGFDVIDVQKGGVDDEEGSVEFIARYAIQGKEQEHHELATFAKVDGNWYFIDGLVAGQATYRREVPKIGRNDPCACGSGKKFKKCCGKPGAAVAG